MQAVYTRKADPSDRRTWIDSFMALEPKGGVRDIVERIQNGKVSGANRHAIHLESVTYIVVAPV